MFTNNFFLNQILIKSKYVFQVSQKLQQVAALKHRLFKSNKQFFYYALQLNFYFKEINYSDSCLMKHVINFK